MLMTRLSIVLLLTMAPQVSSLAMEPQQVVGGLYAEYPWQTVPPGGHGAWYPQTAVAWEQGNADGGRLFLTGGDSGPVHDYRYARGPG